MKAEDQTILTFHERVVASSGRFSVSHENYRTWYLHIRDVEETDKGCYMCQVNTIEMQKQIGCLDVLGERIELKKPYRKPLLVSSTLRYTGALQSYKITNPQEHRSAADIRALEFIVIIR